MKIKEGFLLRELAQEMVVVPVGTTLLNFNGMMTLNDTSTFLWRLLEKGTTEEALIEALLQEYDVSKEQATQDVKAFITQLQAGNFIE